MGDLFNLFDGRFNSTGAGAANTQNASPTIVDPENEYLSSLASGSSRVDVLVDYSDFANFVTFNSAESYVTITADKILNEYPYGGTVADLQNFLDDLDGYQRYFLENWPSWSGHLRFNTAISSSYVSIADFGVENGVARSSFLSPGTGSFSIQGWIDVPVGSLSDPDASMIVLAKQTADESNGFTVYCANSNINLTIVSGALSNWTVSAPLTDGPFFFSAVVDRDAGSMYMYTGTTGSFPALGGTQTISSLGSRRLDLGSGSFYIGSGSAPTPSSSKYVISFTGSIDDLSYWSTARHASALTASYNRKVYAQPDLVACWRFDDAKNTSPRSFASIVRDYSGHRLDGRIQRFFSNIRSTGSLVGQTPDPILCIDDTDVWTYVVTAQRSGSAYDKSNSSMFANLFPGAFTKDNEIFSNFGLAIARHFDRIKLMIDQLVHFSKVRYGDYNQAPDALLEELGAFMGWKMDGSFADADILEFFLGRNVSSGPSSNVGLDQKLSDIRAKFWRRILQNVMYLHKTRGTRESVDALLRTYGVDSGFVRLKEYARKTESRVPLEYVQTKKTTTALAFGSGTLASAVWTPNTGSNFPVIGTGGSFTLEFRVRFPGPTNDDLPPTKLSGSIITLMSGATDGSSTERWASVWYEKPATTSMTGNIYLTSSSGLLTLASASIFDDTFYNLYLTRDSLTGTLTLGVKAYDADELLISSSSFTTVYDQGYISDSVSWNSARLGTWTARGSGQFWMQEVRMWDAHLTETELDAHARNFESYGRDESWDNADLKLHLRLADGGGTDVNGTFYVLDSTPNRYVATGSNFVAESAPFDKFLVNYGYIPSIDYGWNQKKIRTFEGSSIDPLEAYEDERFVSLEFNLMDQLNEDISHIMSSYDELNNFIGLPMNRYRGDYEGLSQMRETYFKRLQGDISFRTFAKMLDFFDRSFVKVVERLLPARALFKGDEFVIESHMLERPKVQYGLRPVREGVLEVSGSISIVDRNEDWA